MALIVMIEDDPLLSRMYSEKMRAAGYEVQVYNDGKKALAAIKKHQPTLVLSDIMLPGMSGLDVLKALKSDKKTKKIPYVFLSNLSRSNEDIERGLELGAIGYLLKADLTPEEIVAKAKEYIDAVTVAQALPERAEERLARAKKHS